MRSLLTAACLVAALGVVGGRAWERWGPVAEAPVPPGAEVAQWDARTCGPASVATLLDVSGRRWTRSELERECRVTARGCAMDDLVEALRRHGVPADAWRATDAAGLGRLPRPFIAHLVPGHYVVAEAVSGGRYAIYDPTFGRRYRWSAGELYRRSGGWAVAAGGKPLWEVFLGKWAGGGAGRRTDGAMGRQAGGAEVRG